MRQPSKFGKYLLLDRIAVGGMAEVFVAKAFGVEGFERLLAIKKILPTMGEDQEFISMFVDEARIAVQLSHANIVQVLELGKHEENLYIAMEYISGRDVRQLLERFRKRGRPMPAPQACLIVAKVCEALDYAHRKRDARGVPLGIVHRDVSPQNVLVSFEGEVKLIDFGIAKAESRLQRTQAGILKGKFSYMSPEQVRGLAVDHRSDIFAAGVLLWELLCGEKLFTGDSDFAVLEKVRNGVVPAPRSINPEISEALERVMRKALATEVADRYQHASDLHDDLTRFTLLGDNVYGSRQLAEWIREDFAQEYEKEQGRLRGWLSVEEDSAEITPVEAMRSRPVLDVVDGAGLQVGARPSLPLPPPPFPGNPTEPSRQELPTQEWRLPVDADTLVQPPTPNGRAATPPRGISGVVGPAPSLSDQELPTMKMDGAELVRAELEWARKAGAKKLAEAPAPAANKLSGQQAESTEVDPVPGAPRPPKVFGAAIQVAPAPSEKPRPGGSNDKTPTLPALFPAGEEVTPQGGGAAPEAQLTPIERALASVARTTPGRLSPSVLPPPSQPKPLPPSLFDNSADHTGAPRAQRKSAFTRPLRDQAKAPASVSPRTLRLIWVPVAVAVLFGLWFVLATPDEVRPGKLVITVSPSVAAGLFIDGKAAGQVPPFVHAAPAGKHRLELRAEGYKPFSAAIAVPSGGRPLEVEAQLVSDGPMQVEGVVLTQPAPHGEEVAHAATAPVAEPARPIEKAPDKPERSLRRWLMGSKKNTPVPERAAPKPQPAPAPIVLAEKPHAAAREVAVAEKPPAAAREVAVVEKPRAPVMPGSATVAVEPAPTPPQKQGEPRLHIVTDPPGAEVSVDGRLVGRAPITTDPLDAQHYHPVSAVLDGYATLRKATKLDLNGITELRLTLTPQKPAPVEATAPTAQQASSVSVPALSSEPAVGAPVGYLVAATKPVARVTIDGHETGRWTPVPPANPIALPAGAHTVVFETADGKKLEEALLIEAGKTARLIRSVP